MTPEQIRELAKQVGALTTPCYGDVVSFSGSELTEFVRLVREVPAGYQLVPIEPTKAIMEAVLGHGAENGTDTPRYTARATRFYQAILEAAKGEAK